MADDSTQRDCACGDRSRAGIHRPRMCSNVPENWPRASYSGGGRAACGDRGPGTNVFCRLAPGHVGPHEGNNGLADPTIYWYDHVPTTIAAGEGGSGGGVADVSGAPDFRAIAERMALGTVVNTSGGSDVLPRAIERFEQELRAAYERGYEDAGGYDMNIARQQSK